MAKNHSYEHDSRNIDASADLFPGSGCTRDLTRRGFIQAIAAGAATLVVSACSGGGGSGSIASVPVSAPPNPSPNPPPGGGQAAPSWRTVPTITFTQGVASSIAVSAYVDDPDNVVQSITKNATALPPGVTYDAANKRFVYDGIGAVSATGGHVLTASDGSS